MTRTTKAQILFLSLCNNLTPTTAIQTKICGGCPSSQSGDVSIDDAAIVDQIVGGANVEVGVHQQPIGVIEEAEEQNEENSQNDEASITNAVVLGSNSEAVASSEDEPVYHLPVVNVQLKDHLFRVSLNNAESATFGDIREALSQHGLDRNLYKRMFVNGGLVFSDEKLSDYEVLEEGYDILTKQDYSESDVNINTNLPESQEQIDLLIKQTSTYAKQQDGMKALQQFVELNLSPNMVKSVQDSREFSQEQGERPIHKAVQDAVLTRGLLKLGADPNALYKCRSSLAFAVEYKNIDSLKLLLDAGAHPDGLARICGASPLHLAGMMGESDMVEMLISYGANFDKKLKTDWHNLKKGSTPLHLTIPNIAVNVAEGKEEEEKGIGLTQGHVDVVRILLEAGANPTATDAFGITPIDRATGMITCEGCEAQKYKWEIIKLLMTASEQWVTMADVSRRGFA